MGVLTEEDGALLISIARQAIQAQLNSENYSPENVPSHLKQNHGVFCTLKAGHGVLRGCIGLPYPVKPLIEALQEAATSAAFSDPRFKPLTKQEDFKIEITVLTQPEPFSCPKQDIPSKIVIGKHGLIVKKGITSGLLLPQVASDSHMSAIEFLEATCWKAGLPVKSWRDEGIEILFFEGQVFEERT